MGGLGQKAEGGETQTPTAVMNESMACFRMLRRMSFRLPRSQAPPCHRPQLTELNVCVNKPYSAAPHTLSVPVPGALSIDLNASMRESLNPKP